MAKFSNAHAWRSGRILLTIAAAWLLAGSGWLAGLSAKGADRLPASKVLPQNTVAFVEVSSVTELIEGFNESNFGRMIAAGTPDEVRRDDAVITAYLGHAPA